MNTGLAIRVVFQELVFHVRYHERDASGIREEGAPSAPSGSSERIEIGSASDRLLASTPNFAGILYVTCSTLNIELNLPVYQHQCHVYKR